MTRLDPPNCEETRELAPHFRRMEDERGYVPNELLTMARKPNLVEAFAVLCGAVYDPVGKVAMALRILVGIAASVGAACRYYMAQSADNARRTGVADEKIATITSYESSPLFTEAERVALRFSQSAASVPNMVTESDFAA